VRRSWGASNGSAVSVAPHNDVLLFAACYQRPLSWKLEQERVRQLNAYRNKVKAMFLTHVQTKSNDLRFENQHLRPLFCPLVVVLYLTLL
jgi:hypothetical protein